MPITIHEIQLKNIQGDDYTIVQPCNLYDCTLGKKVFIGPFTEIQNDVVIGEHTRIQSHTFICSKVVIGKNCFIGHGVMFTNDLMYHMTTTDHTQTLPTTIGDNVVIGSNSTILPVNICSNVLIGAGSIVTRDITISGIYKGNPARLSRIF